MQEINYGLVKSATRQEKIIWKQKPITAKMKIPKTVYR